MVYSNDINEMSNRINYKLRWTLDEISVFVQESRQHIVNNKHDALIFVLSACMLIVREANYFMIVMVKKLILSLYLQIFNLKQQHFQIHVKKHHNNQIICLRFATKVTQALTY